MSVDTQGKSLCETDERGTREIIRSYLAKDRTIPGMSLAKQIWEDYKPKWKNPLALCSAIRVVRGQRVTATGKLISDTTFFLNEAEKHHLKQRIAATQSTNGKRSGKLSLGRLSELGIEIQRLIKRYPRLNDYRIGGVLIREQPGRAAHIIGKRVLRVRESLKARNEYPYDKK